MSHRAQQASYRFLHAAEVYGRTVNGGYALDLDAAQRDNVVTGEPRRSEFEALFDGDHVNTDGVPMISWFAK